MHDKKKKKKNASYLKSVILSVNYKSSVELYTIIWSLKCQKNLFKKKRKKMLA